MLEINIHMLVGCAASPPGVEALPSPAHSAHPGTMRVRERRELGFCPYCYCVNGGSGEGVGEPELCIIFFAVCKPL